MINTDNNPVFLNSFLDYIETILNKSPNTIREYNYDIINFLKFISMHFKLTGEKNFQKINIKDMSIDTIKKITLEDLHAYLAFLTRNKNDKASTRSRKVSSIKTFFNYLTTKASLLETNPARKFGISKIR